MIDPVFFGRKVVEVMQEHANNVKGQGPRSRLDPRLLGPARKTRCEGEVDTVLRKHFEVCESSEGF